MASNIKANLSEDKIPPITITDKITDTQYTLDFDRMSVKFAEDRGFQLENVTKFPVSTLPLFFFYAFRAHHKDVPKSKVDAFYDRLGGLSVAFIERLMLLYDQAQQSNNVVESTEEMGKNGDMMVEL